MAGKFIAWLTSHSDVGRWVEENRCLRGVSWASDLEVNYQNQGKEEEEESKDCVPEVHPLEDGLEMERGQGGVE